MEIPLPPLILLIILLSTLSSSSVISTQNPQSSSFIIHVSKSSKPHIYTSHDHWYSSILHSHPNSKHLYTYNHAVFGFSATLTQNQANIIRRIPGILSVLPDRLQQLHTTHTPTFLGLTDSFGLWPNADYADDVIIGVLDTGIWPERDSFDDEGLSPVPSSWKGVCESAPDFPASLCNKKIIGARAYYKGYLSNNKVNSSNEKLSVRDTEGHGTHTASTAAGSVVKDAGFYEYAKGEARGMAIKARIAAYKICWPGGCYDSDILAAMDQAIEDGVHIISLSVGATGYAPQYDRDSIAIGAFGATRNGVVVSCSAGNSGPGPYTAVNIAPWIITVGASTIDREFPADVILGDGRIYGGVSLYSGDSLGDTQIPLIYGEDCGSRYCYSRNLDPVKVKGKIVICDRGGNARVEKGSAVKIAGGVGMIHANTDENGEELLADSHLIPATMVGQVAGDKIRAYSRSDKNPTATITFKGTVIGNSPSAPRVASFSSRGPNHLTAEILKPDVIGPGVNILAGWTGYTSPTDLDIDPRRVAFNIISGTSMSCPHVSGLAALLRKTYPKWSPAAIKSALMTTAYNVDNTGLNITDLATGVQSTPFVHGAGHVEPNRALDPGLVYDIDVSHYVAFLCSIGYTPKRIAVFVGNDKVDCSAENLGGSPGNLNYPSFAVVFDDSNEVKYKRTVKNVGNNVNAVYEVKVSAPPGVGVNVLPSKLEFSATNETLSYEVTFTSTVAAAVGNKAFGAIEWTDGVHLVRSPVAVSWSSNSAASVASM